MILLNKTSEKRIFQLISHMGLNFGRTSIYQNSPIFLGQTEESREELPSVLAKEKRISHFSQLDKHDIQTFVSWGKNESEGLVLLCQLLENHSLPSLALLSFSLRAAQGRICTDCNFINNQITCSIQCKHSDGKIFSASIDSVLHAAKLMLTIQRDCATAGQVTRLRNNIHLGCAVYSQHDTKSKFMGYSFPLQTKNTPREVS